MSGGNAELIEDGKTGYLVPVRDPEAIAQRLLELLADPALRQSMGQAARVWAEAHFTREVHAQRVTECYETIRAEA
jgi:glycosyltransferase involved in cell wall biosynthesis